MVDGIHFIRGFLRDPAGVGSVWPSSAALAGRVARLGRAGYARTVIELGPGTGAVTGRLLASMPVEARLVAIERDPGFARHVRERFGDPRLTLMQGSSLELLPRAVAERGAADLIVSGIPFSTLLPDEARATLRAVAEALAPGGRFVAYQVRSHVERLATPLLGPPLAEVIEPLNVPPMRIYVWEREAGGGNERA